MKKLLYILSVLIFISCTSDDNSSLLIVTNDISNISFASATSGGNITNDGGTKITLRGVVWNTSQNPTINLLTKTFDGSGTGSFTSNLSGLTDNTTYYVRAYATNSAGTTYGNEVIFTTNLQQSLFYLAENGVTCKCENVRPGDTGFIDGIEYEAVDSQLLILRRIQGADLTKLCTSLVTNMSELFMYQNQFNQTIGNWDVSNVTDMSKMFFDNTSFNQEIGYWDVSNVSNMSQMFQYSIFNQPIGNWDVSNVSNMFQMFQNSNFNQPIGNWDVSNVQNMSSMFFRSEFNQPINNWDVSSVTTMWNMFGTSPFNKPLENWDVSSVTQMSGMFSNSPFNQPIENWNVSKVFHMENMFRSTPFNQPLGNWDVRQVFRMTGMFNNSSFNQNISGWCVSNIPTEPSRFSEGAPLIPENKPIWGTCP